MNVGRLAATGVALVVTLGLAGCGPDIVARSSEGDRVAASSAPADPRADLTAAALKINETSLQVGIISGMVNGGGVLDPRTRSSDVTLRVESIGKFRMISLGDDGYLQITGPEGVAGSWLHLDAGKLGADSPLKIMPNDDPGGAKKMISAVREVRRTGGHSFAGTVDYTKTASIGGSLKAYGDKAKSVPFTAALDDQGRLTVLEVDLTVLDPSLGKLRTTYSKFGVPVNPKRPPSWLVREAPEELLGTVGA